MALSVLQVKILIHYAMDNGIDFGPWSQAAEEECRKFHLSGLLLLSESGNDFPKYKGNIPALSVYLKAICEVPLPVQAWVIPPNQ